MDNEKASDLAGLAATQTPPTSAAATAAVVEMGLQYEASVLNRIGKILDPLPPAARKRVVAYMHGLYGQ